MTKGRRVTALLLLAAALVLAGLGQYYFFRRRDYLWDGVVFHLLAALCFVLAWRLSLPQKRQGQDRKRLTLAPWLRQHWVPAVLLALGVCLSLVATLWSQTADLGELGQGAVLFWALAVGTVGLATLWPASRPASLERLRAKMGRETWLEAATVAGLTLLALVLRVAALDSVPFTLGGDEAWFGLSARQVLDGNIQNPFSIGYIPMPTFFYWPLSWSLALAGNNVAGLRLPAALVGTVTVPLLYLFARDLWGKRTAFLATAFLATYDYHIHYSRLGANNVWDPLFVLLALWALDRGLVAAIGNGTEQQENAYRSFLALGFVLGLSTFFYTGARLLPPLVIIYVAFIWLKRRRQARQLGMRLVLLLALAGLAFLVVAGPMLSYALSHPNEWNARLNQVGILQSGWLEREPELTGKSTPQILAEQFLRAAGAFHVFPDRTVWYGAERPLLGWLAGLFGLLGMVWSVVHWRDRRYFLVLIWFWSVIITGGMLTESPPSSQRLVIAIPAVALLVAFGLEQSVRLVWRLAQGPREWENVALGLLILLLAVGNVRFYFLEFSPARRYGSENGETATMIGHYLRDLDDDYEAYLLGAPRIYWKFGTMQFIAPDVPGQDIVDPLSAPPDLELEGNTVFVFLPEREGELSWVEQAFPGGQRQDFRDAGGRLRFIVYQVGR